MKKVLLAAALGTLAACSDATSPSISSTSRTPSLDLASGNNTVAVRESDIARQAENTLPTKSWVFYKRNEGDGSFTLGPATPPAGNVSFEISTPASGDKGWLFNYDHMGTPLADIDAISYNTYRSAGNLQQVTALNLEIDFNGPSVTGGYATLVFEPVYNTAQGAVVNSLWQSWDAYDSGNAIWWSTKSIPGVCDFNCFVTWNDILAANPDATIFGGFGINQGSGNETLVTAIDALKIGYAGSSITYDFEDTSCHFADDPVNKTKTLEGNCTTTETISIGDGYTLDGNHFTITAVEPSSGAFTGPIISATNVTASVHDLTVTANNLSGACGALSGIYFFNTTGTISNNTVTNVNRGPNGCQDGNGIEVRNTVDAADYVAVTLSGNTVNGYNKNGITANGSVSVEITNNTVTGSGPLGLGFAAQNGIQISRGATGVVKSNVVSGNDYTPKSYVACGLLLYMAEGVRVSSNDLFNNEMNQCNYGKGGGKVKELD